MGKTQDNMTAAMTVVDSLKRERPREPVSECALRYDAELGWRTRDEVVTSECPVTLFLNGEEVATIVCSPWDVDHLGVGFLVSEGLVKSRSDLEAVEVDVEEGVVRVSAPASGLISDKAFLKRRIDSCCGRGRVSFYFATDALVTKPIVSDLVVTPAWVLDVMGEIARRSVVFRETGGVHAGILASPGDDEVLQFHEDVGRNNVLDRICGQSFLEGVDLSDKVVAFSGRVSSEIVLKVAKMGVPILISHSAPTELGLRYAHLLGLTVIGFARQQNRFNLYTHMGRVLT